MEEDIKKAAEIISSGGTILYPTDTIWGIGCDATNAKAVQKVIKVKSRPKDFSFIILIEKEGRLKEYVADIPDILWDLVRSFDAPTTVIYPKAKNLPKNVIAKDGSIAIRIVKDEFCRRLIGQVNKPLVSSSANLSGEQAPVMFRDISDEMKKRVDYVVQSNQLTMSKMKASMMIKLNSKGEFDIIRD